jgi:hypothetical protein
LLAYDPNAKQIKTDVTNFNTNLTSAETDVQKALDKLDEAAGGSMTYPGAGIPLSTGSAWGTSITNNSSNWDAAYGWGNHAGLYLGASAKAADSDKLDNHDSTYFQVAGSYLVAGDITGKEDTSNKVTSITSGSTDTQYPSAKLLYDQLAGKQASGSYLTEETDPSALKTNGTDNIKDTHIDWGTGTGQVSTDDITEGSTNKFERDSGTNTGDNATNSNYSGLAASKQDVVNDTTDLLVKSLGIGKNGTGGAEGILTLKDGANPGVTSTLSRTKWADLEAETDLLNVTDQGIIP